jgi:hypothetical protein
MSNPKDVPKLPPIELRDLASMELKEAPTPPGVAEC